MTLIEALAQGAFQTLSNSAWTGIGVITSTIISSIALIISLPILKKTFNTHGDFKQYKFFPKTSEIFSVL